MYNSDTELIFPARVIPDLRNERGAAWRKLVDKTSKAAPDSIEVQSFVLMMARLDGCSSCNADSFRAMRGCTQCALQNIRRHRGDDAELVRMVEKAQADLEKKYSSGKK